MSEVSLVTSHVSDLNAIANKPSLSMAIINHLGGVSAFEIAADMLDLGISINKIKGFKYDIDTVSFFKENKEVILQTFIAICDDMNVPIASHLFNVCHIHRFSYEEVNQCHDILFFDEIAKKASDNEMALAAAAAHQVVLNVVTVILETYTKHKNKWY